MSAPRLNLSPGALAVLYFFSGATSLGYEMLWARMLSLQFGVSTFGVVVTVGAFMFGLGAGSLYGASSRAYTLRPLYVYGVLEISIGIFAAIAPFVVRLLGDTVSAVTADASVTTWHAAHAVADVLLMTLPSFAMGLAFPMILAAGARGAHSLGTIYGLNALGGVVGALAPVLLLPVLGWFATTQLFAAAGVAVGAIALILARSAAPVSAETQKPARIGAAILGRYAVIGAGALMLEIGWTRVYGMVLLRTEYVLAVIVAVFLAGIGLGSVLARYLTRPGWIRILPLLVAGCALMTLALLAPVSGWIESTTFSSLPHAIAVQAGVLVALTFPATLVFGAWLPLLAGRFERGEHAGARLYGANSIGAALGTLGTGFVLIPAIGTAATIAVAALLVVWAGMTLAQARPMLTALAVGAVALASLPLAQLSPAQQLSPRALADTRDVFVHEDAVTMTHVVERADGQRLLLDDLQRMDASSDPDAVVLQQNQVRLGLLLHPQAQSALLLGLGTGISASAALLAPQLDVTAVELSRGAIQAARDQFAPVNGDVTRHIRIVRDDARRALARTADYDLIVGDLFHPDLAGRSALLSIEQFRRARARLGADGVFMQWLALNQFDATSLDIILRSFLSVFPHGVLYVDPFRIALVGGASDRVPGIAANATRYAGEEGIDTWRGRYLGRIAVHVGMEGPVQSELAPRIEFLLPKARYRGELDVAALLQRLLKHRPAWRVAADELGVMADQHAEFERSYHATELALAGWIATLKNRTDDGARLLQLAHQANPRDRWIGVALVTPAWEQFERARRQGQAVRDVFGKDERDVLDALLRIRPDFLPALKASYELERATGNITAAEQLRARVREVSPLAVLE